MAATIRVVHGSLDELWEKANKRYKFRAYSPVKQGPDPKAVDILGRHGHFMRMPTFDGYHCWCFETDIHRDRFVMDFAHLGVTEEKGR